MDLVTLAQVKLYLGITTDTTDDLLRMLITAASASVESYCSRRFASQTYVETRSGNGKNTLLLINGPVTALTKLSVGQTLFSAAVTDPITGQPSLYQNGWRLLDILQGDQRMLILNQGGFCLGQGNVAITYVAGYPVIVGTPPQPDYVAVPADLAQAVCELTALKFKSREWIGYTSKTLATETISFDVKDYPNWVKTTLNSYRPPGIPL